MAAHRLLAGAMAAAIVFPGAAWAGDRWDRDRHWGHDWHGDWHHGHGHSRHHYDNDDDAAAALVIGGILGLAVGAALADDGPGYSYGSSSYGYSGPDYGYGYYDPPQYYDPPSYSYAPPPTSSYPSAPPTYASVPCEQVRSGRTATGAVIGGVVGGLLGNGVAADKNREEGTAVGVALGSVIGGSLGHSSADCGGAYYQAGLAAPAPAYPAPPSYPYQEPSYPYSEPSYEYELEGGPGYSSSGPAAEECERTMRVTRFPDGRELHEPVTVCRQAYYGDWSVQD